MVEFSVAFLLFSPHFAFLLFHLWKCDLEVLLKAHLIFSDLNILPSLFLSLSM